MLEYLGQENKLTKLTLNILIISLSASALSQFLHETKREICGPYKWDYWESGLKSAPNGV